MAWENLAEDLEEEFAGLQCFDRSALSQEALGGFQVLRRYGDTDKAWVASWRREDRRLNPGKYRAKRRRWFKRLRSEPVRYERFREYQRRWLRDYRAQTPRWQWRHITIRLNATLTGPNAGRHLARYAARMRKVRELIAIHHTAPKSPPGRKRRLTPEQRAWVRSTHHSPTEVAKVLGVTKQAIHGLRRAQRKEAINVQQ